MYKLLIALWKRPEVTEVCFQGVERLRKKGCEPICIYSDVDNKVLVNQYGYEGYYHENLPLGAKLNFGVDRALESDWEYMMQIGSDDIISDELVDAYKDIKEQAFGINTVYFYDLKSGQSAKGWSPYPFGCARMLHRSCFDKKYRYKVRFKQSVAGSDFHYGRGREMLMDYDRMMAFNNLVDVIEEVDITSTLWDDQKNRSLDFNSQIRLAQKGIKVKSVELPGVNIVDLKSDVNIWKFDFFDKVDFDVTDNLPERDAIRKLRQVHYNTELHDQ